ncbi:SRPBCC domain-containing protein [Microbacterium sp. NPDC089695]|uniref:SRPBCC domain-containing protein n=1 Tax=Microbacterium sp. NPDC089695 TaxID=3364198 RepID=UPI0038305E63
MKSPSIDPHLDLTIERIIQAPASRIWRAWTEPEELAQWWVPAPSRTRVDALDVVPGGAFVTSMSEDGEGEFVPHTDGIFLVVEPPRRLVFTNVIDRSWHPAAPTPVGMTAEVRLEDHEDGTRYRAIVRHASPADRDTHDALGFHEGWGAVTAALAALVEGEDHARRPDCV